MDFKFGLYTDIGPKGCHAPFAGSFPNYQARVDKCGAPGWPPRAVQVFEAQHPTLGGRRHVQRVGGRKLDPGRQQRRRRIAMENDVVFHPMVI